MSQHVTNATTKRFVIKKLPINQKLPPTGKVNIIKLPLPATAAVGGVAATQTTAAKKISVVSNGSAPRKLLPARIAIAKELQELQKQFKQLETEEATEAAEALHVLAARPTLQQQQSLSSSAVQTDANLWNVHNLRRINIAKQLQNLHAEYRTLGNEVQQIKQNNVELIERINKKIKQKSLQSKVYANQLPSKKIKLENAYDEPSYDDSSDALSKPSYNDSMHDGLYEECIDFPNNLAEDSNLTFASEDSFTTSSIFAETLPEQPSMHKVVETVGQVTNITRYIRVPKWNEQATIPKTIEKSSSPSSSDNKQACTSTATSKPHGINRRVTATHRSLTRKSLSITQLLPLIKDSATGASISSTAYEYNKGGPAFQRPMASSTSHSKTKVIKLLEPKSELLDPELEQEFQENLQYLSTNRSFATQTSKLCRFDCAMLSLSNGRDFVISCFHCQEEFKIFQYHLFIKHLTDKHMPLITHLRAPVGRQLNFVISKQTESETNKATPSKISATNTTGLDDIIAQALQDEQNAIDLLAAEEKTLQATDNIILVEECDESPINKEVWTEDKLIEKEILDKRTTISFSSSSSKIVMDLLCLLKCYPILWYARQAPYETYDSACYEIASKINKRWSLKVLNQEMCRIVHNIKCWYRNILQTGNYKADFHAYFMKCAEFLPNHEQPDSALTLRCEHCAGMFFYDDIDLQVHLHMCHRLGELPRKCAQCNDGIDLQNIKHECKYTEVHTYFCQHCEKSYFGERWLKLHQMKHRNPTEQLQLHVCDVCGKNSTTAANLRAHQILHLPKQHECTLCGMKYHRTSDYNVHMRRHRNERNYVCYVCGSRHFSSKILNCHIRKAHVMRGKPRYCQVCKKVFYGDSGLFYHMRSKHLVREGTIEELTEFETTRQTRRKYTYVTDPETNRRYLKCDDCGKLYRDMTCMRKHREKVHGYQWPVTERKPAIPKKPKNKEQTEWWQTQETVDASIESITKQEVEAVEQTDEFLEMVALVEQQQDESIQCITANSAEELLYLDEDDIIVEEEKAAIEQNYNSQQSEIEVHLVYYNEP